MALRRCLTAAPCHLSTLLAGDPAPPRMSLPGNGSAAAAVLGALPGGKLSGRTLSLAGGYHSLHHHAASSSAPPSLSRLLPSPLPPPSPSAGFFAALNEVHAELSSLSRPAEPPSRNTTRLTTLVTHQHQHQHPRRLPPQGPPPIVPVGHPAASATAQPQQQQCVSVLTGHRLSGQLSATLPDIHERPRHRAAAAAAVAGPAADILGGGAATAPQRPSLDGGGAGMPLPSPPPPLLLPPSASPCGRVEPLLNLAVTAEHCRLNSWWLRGDSEEG